MLPSNAAAEAAYRWIRLLRGSSVSQAWLILRSDPHYTDLTQSQYGAALDLLRSIGMIDSCAGTVALAKQYRELPAPQASQLLFEKMIEQAAPAWLPDSDILVPDPSEIPEDAAQLGSTLGLQELQCYAAVRNVHNRVNLEKRKLIGDAGELALLRFLEEKWPGATVHIAALGDGYGYDIAFRYKGQEWHLEVKSTTRRGRLTIHLSRNEYEVSLSDPHWRLIVAGLDENLQLKALATLMPGQLGALAPADTSIRARWQSAAFEINKSSLSKGICLPSKKTGDADANESFTLALESQAAWFEWLPVC